MKKATIFGMVFLLTFIPFTNNSPHVLAAEFCDQYQNVDKIYWDELELKKGQLGRLHVKQDTNIYSLDGDKKIYYSTLKQGNTFRIYSFLPNKLGVGAGYYIDRDAKIEYETPSKTKLDAVKCLDNKKRLYL